MNELDGIVNEFLVESFENLEQVDRDLVAVEANPDDGKLIDRIFRVIHTVKGTCGFLGFEKLEELSHSGESFLAALRDGTLPVTADATSLLLELADGVRTLLTTIENTGGEGNVDFSDLAARLRRELSRAKLKARTRAGKASGSTASSADPSKHPSAKKKASKKRQPDPSDDPAGGNPGETRTGGAGPEAADPSSPSEPPSVSDHRPGPAVRNSADSYVRVDVRVLDRLMDLVGELVLSRNQLLRMSEVMADSLGSAAIQQLNLITGELQDGIMRTRMQPVSRVWGKFPRLVRDLAAGCGKKVRLEMEGQDTELDRSLIEAIRDPLTHLVRNAVDHGIELPEARKAAGKAPTGRIRLRAYHEGGHVTIEVTDDGAGLDEDAIRKQAIERRLLPPGKASRISHQDVLNLLFIPGFSTAEKVTNLSGRGVGLDVVKTNVERVNGMIDVESIPGTGTTFRLKIPLTLAIIPALVVMAAEERFAIPQVSIIEMVRLGTGDGSGVEMVQGVPVYRLRGRLLPLVDLRSELRLGPRADATGSLTIVVLQADDREFGLVVDGVVDTQEIVVKPLGDHLKRIAVYAGATIMGDGKVALILDVLGLAQRSHVISEHTDQSFLTSEETAERTSSELEQLVLFKSPDDGRMGIPLSRAVRLEQVPRSAIEPIGDSYVVQYRGDILPLVFVFEHLPERRNIQRIEAEDRPTDVLDVVVYAHNGQNVGLVVGRILDIVEEPVQVRRPSSREGVLACIVVRDRVTELLDVDGVIRKANLPLLAHQKDSGETS